MFDININVIGHNEKGLIGFIDGTYELIYIQKPKDYDSQIATLNLPYITKENVKEVNKAGREAVKNAKKGSGTEKKEVHSDN